MLRKVSFAESREFNGLMDNFILKPYNEVEIRLQKLANKTKLNLLASTEVKPCNQSENVTCRKKNEL